MKTTNSLGTILPPRTPFSPVELIALVVLAVPMSHVSAQTRAVAPAPLPTRQQMTSHTRPASVTKLESGTTAVRKLESGTTDVRRLGPGTIVVRQDIGVEHLGGKVYTTGMGDVIVGILTRDELQHPTGKPHGFSFSFPSDIYLLSPGPERFIGSNQRDGGKIVNLGKLPPGELVFGIKALNSTFRTGDASRNPDGLAHVITKTFSSGMIEIWFEDFPGAKGSSKGADCDFNDVGIRLSGDIANIRRDTAGAVADLLKLIKEQKGEIREVAIAALKKIDPTAAANAGFR